MRQSVYYIRNLGCANCAAKIEAKINALPQVEEAIITFAIGQLRVTAEDPEALFETMAQIIRTIEPDARLDRGGAYNMHARHHDYAHHC